MLSKPDTLTAGVVREPYKLLLIRSLKSGKIDTLLFNLDDKSNSRPNLYPAQTAMADSLSRGLGKYLVPTEFGSYQVPEVIATEEIQRLKALGYIN